MCSSYVIFVWQQVWVTHHGSQLGTTVVDLFSRKICHRKIFYYIEIFKFCFYFYFPFLLPAVTTNVLTGSKKHLSSLFFLDQASFVLFQARYVHPIFAHSVALNVNKSPDINHSTGLFLPKFSKIISTKF